jgi:hypothetical protein
MRIARIMAACAVAIAGFGCGAEPCGDWREQYDLHFDARPTPAPCGQIPDIVTTAERLGAVGPNCSGESRLEPCEVILDEVCCPPGVGTCTTVRGTLAQADGPAYLEGVWTLTTRDGATGEVRCLQTYDVTGRAL